MRSADSAADGSATRLRTIARVGMASIAVLVMIACVALVVLTMVTRRYAERAEALNESLRATDHLRIDFATYLRQGALEYIMQDPAYAASRLGLEADLLADLREARRVAADPRQRAALADASHRLGDYLMLARAANRRVGLSRSLVDAADAVQEKLRQVSRIGFDRVAASEDKLERWELIENILSTSIALLVLAGFVVVGLSMRALILKPLLALGDGIDRFAAGDIAARVVPSGPEALRHTANSFNEMAERLARRRRDLLTFLAGVAHDLRNPLAAMRLGVQYLEPARSGTSAQNERLTLQMIGRQVTRLERMVGDFLDASRIEAGHLELRRQPIDLRELAAEAVQLYSGASLQHHIELAAPAGPVEIRADPTRIAQVLNNLVANAVKYSPGGGDVVVTVATEGGEAIVSVEDAGIGIARADLARIFEPFRRTDASRDAAPGVGLGLSVARRIVEAHGGRIEVHSTVGLGSTFRVHLPLGDAAPALATAPEH